MPEADFIALLRERLNDCEIVPNPVGTDKSLGVYVYMIYKGELEIAGEMDRNDTPQLSIERLAELVARDLLTWIAYIEGIDEMRH